MGTDLCVCNVKKQSIKKNFESGLFAGSALYTPSADSLESGESGQEDCFANQSKPESE